MPSSIDAAAVARAIEIVKTDPNFSREQTIKVLRWKSSTNPAKTPGWFEWLSGLFRWLDQSARVLIWCAAVVAVALLVVHIIRMVQASRAGGGSRALEVPTHVRELDIRPESLPADVGAAARALWEAGDHRGALALLYRGVLSRLAHVHAVPIRESTTEGDCLALAAVHLSTERRDYTGHLVSVWQRAVYGGREAPASTVYRLCDEFAAMLDQPPMPPLLGGAA